MPQSTDVNLPRNHSARFPSSCVRCGDDPANGTVRLWTHTIGWSTWVFWMFGRGFSTHAPACAGCGWRIRFQRVGGVLLTLAIAGVFLFFVLHVLFKIRTNEYTRTQRVCTLIVPSTSSTPSVRADSSSCIERSIQALLWSQNYATQSFIRVCTI